MTGFVFFESFQAMIDEMPEEMGNRFYRYICEYGLHGKEPELKEGVERALWIPIKLSIDSMQTKSKRGRPRKQQAQTAKTLANEAAQETQSEQAEIQSENLVPAPKTKKNGFQKPTVEQITEYVSQNGYSVDSSRFYDFYEANGWRVGQNPMKDWQAAVRNWEGNNRYGNSKEATFVNGDIGKYGNFLGAKTAV